MFANKSDTKPTTKTRLTKAKKEDFRKLTMDQISGQFHQKIHSLETMFLDTDDLLWEVNHKAYQDDPKIMDKLKTDLKDNFSGLRKRVIDISKLMKNYIDSDVITENVAVKFMKYMSKKHRKKSQSAHDISLTEVLDFLNGQSQMRHMKKNEKQVFKNAEMLNSFLLSKHFQFDSDDSASALYKQSKNSFEKTIKNAIGLSNFISSFGQIISSKLLNSAELSEIKTRARKTKDVPVKKKGNQTISFELYQIPSKNQNNLIAGLAGAGSGNDRALGTGSGGSKASLDSGLKPDKNRAGGSQEDEDMMPSIQELIAKKKRRIEMDKKRFSHKKISYKISEDEKLKKQNKLDINEQTPQEIEDVDADGTTEIETDQSPLNTSSQVNLDEGSQSQTASHSGTSSGIAETQDMASSQSLNSVQSQDQIETDSQMSVEDKTLNPSHFDLEASPLSSAQDSAKSGNSSVKSENSSNKSGDSSVKSGDSSAHESNASGDLEMDKNLHIDKPSHILDTEEGDYDENDPQEIQELDKEEARLKKLEKLGYPKVEKIDLEVKKPLNSYGLHSMSLTSSVKKFDGNPDASNAYKTLNVIMSKPFQEMKEEFQESKDQVTEADPNDVEMVEPQTHMNTMGLSLDEDEGKDLKRGLRQRQPTYEQMKQNYMRQLRMRRPRNLRQVSLSSLPYTPLSRNYSDRDMYRKRSFLPQKELNAVRVAKPPARNLLQNVRRSRPVHRKNLKQKTDALYAKMLKMKF